MDTAGCPDHPAGCGGDAAAHGPQVPTARPAAESSVDCPECGEPSSPQRIASWGHCRACRTADSRAKSPLRW
ncbi:hypothetical protein [Modestobacter excelsi]|uniref:hypothetical protein n=1 Tax=Modestobacter excelsi TaxID=2213161 RepID=UPI00110CEF1B|nr:hypothetical protein [Modestobacter excelsi]